MCAGALSESPLFSCDPTGKVDLRLKLAVEQRQSSYVTIAFITWEDEYQVYFDVVVEIPFALNPSEDRQCRIKVEHGTNFNTFYFRLSTLERTI